MPASETAQSELDLRLFHLKTLYDVSRELLGIVDIQVILKNFLLMTLGNFGVAEGFIFAHDSNSTNPGVMVGFGFQDDVLALLESESLQTLNSQPFQNVIGADEIPENYASLEPPLACLLTFIVDDGFKGIIGLGPRIIDEPYGGDDKNLLETLINNLVVALKNARSAAALKEAYEEVTILNRAKDKLINHLAHELKTPLAVLLSSLKLIKKRLAPVPPENWQRVMQRAEKNLQRLLEIPENILLDQFVEQQLLKINPYFSHRNVELKMDMQPAASIQIPSEPLEKLIAGLIKNAIENTPDEGKIKVLVRNRQKSIELVIKDSGVGIVEEHRHRIFEGFFPTQEIDSYSSKAPFDFNAGGRGADLLRMKIFSERFNFKLHMQSTRCHYIPLPGDVCPGRISQCSFCQSPEDCYASGGTTFRAVFPVSEM
jgi:signal transduction histidine kinase